MNTTDASITAPKSQALFEVLLDSSLPALKKSDTVADYFGLPKCDQIPRPGEVRMWSFDEWADWGRPFGFEEIDQSKHNRRLQHPLLPAIMLAMAGTPGDWRSAMNCAAEFRRDYRAALVSLTYGLVGFASTGGDTTFQLLQGMSDASACAVLSSKIIERGGMPLASMMDGARESKPIEPAEVGRLLRVIEKEMHLSPRQVLRDRLKMPGDQVDRLLMAIKQNIPMGGAIEALEEDLKDLMEAERDRERAEKEAKRAEREARDAEREARRATSAAPVRPQSSGERLLDAFSASRHKVVAQAERAAADLQQLMSSIRALDLPDGLFEMLDAAEKGRLEAVAKAASMDADLTAARIRADQAVAALADVSADRDTLKQLLAEADRDTTDRDQLAAMVRVITTRLSAGADFMKVAQGVSELQVLAEEARKRLPAG